MILRTDLSPYQEAILVGLIAAQGRRDEEYSLYRGGGGGGGSFEGLGAMPCPPEDVEQLARRDYLGVQYKPSGRIDGAYVTPAGRAYVAARRRP